MKRIRRLPPLNAIRSFEAAAHHGSFLRAAEELNVTPGAVSRMVKALEEHLDIALFDRQHRAIALTEDGRRYADSLSQALDLVGQATDRLMLSNNANVLSVCCHPTFAVHWLLPRWARFHQMHPDIQIELKTTLHPEAASSNSYDFIVRVDRNIEPRSEQGLVSERVVNVDSFPVCSPDLVRRIPLDKPEDLRNHVLLHGALRPNDWQRWLEAAGIDNVPCSGGHTFESLTLAYNAAISGAGVAIGVETFVAQDLATGRLIRPFDFVRRSVSGFNMIYDTERHRKYYKVRVFRDWLLQEHEEDKAQSTGAASEHSSG